MHVIHHTEAFVIKSMPAGEANKRVWLYTRELGYVVALVQGVRKSSAKLQGHIVDYSLIKADLVQGKEVWRLISATSMETPLAGIERNPLARAFARTLSAIDRFLVGEGPHEEIFAHLMECVDVVREGTINAKAFDALSLWRVLVHLGYIAVDEMDELFFSLPFREAIAITDEPKIKYFIEMATTAIKESHL